MKKFKQFRAEQQYITEVGPFASAMMGAMGVIGVGMAGWKLFQTAKKKIKGYKETSAEKKDNKTSGVSVKIKKWDEKKGKVVDVTVEIAPAGSSKAGMSNEDIKKEQKKLQLQQDPKNTAAQNAYETDEQEAEDERDGIEDVKDAEAAYKNSNENEKKRKAPPGWENVGTKQEPELMTTKDAEKEEARREKVGAPDGADMQAAADAADSEAAEKERREKEEDEAGKEDQERTVAKDKEKKDTEDAAEKEKQDATEKEKEERGGIEEPKDAEVFFKNNKKAPKGWKDVRTKSEKDKKHKNFKDFKGSILTTADAKKFKEKKKKLGKQPTEKKKTDVKKVEKPTNNEKQERNILSFGEFITEGVMNDLLKAGKSKKDSEISLDDGADIPIDPLTSQILVKYIEGLSSSEKNRTIQQIQRTERAFMKVLGKAHENT